MERLIVPAVVISVVASVSYAVLGKDIAFLGKIRWMQLRRIILVSVIAIFPVSYILGGWFAVVAYPIASWFGLFMLSRKAISIMKNGYIEEPGFTSVLGGETIQTTSIALSVIGICLAVIVFLIGDIKDPMKLESYWNVIVSAIEAMISGSIGMYLASGVNNYGKLLYPKSPSDFSGKFKIDIDTTDFASQISDVVNVMVLFNQNLKEMSEEGKTGTKFMKELGVLLPAVSAILETCSKFFPEKEDLP